MFTFSKSAILVALLVIPSQSFAQADTLRLTKQTVYDSGFGVRMASHTVLAPVGWKVEGGGFWAHSKYYQVAPSQEISIVSNDGYRIDIGPIMNANDARITNAGAAKGIQMMPQFESDMGRVVFARPDSLEEWADAYAKYSMPNLKSGKKGELTEVFEIPELTAVIEHHLGPTRKNLEQGNVTNRKMNFEQSCDGVAIGFRTRFNVRGQEMESLHVFFVTTVYTHTSDYTKLEWNIVKDVRFHAPMGKLDAKLNEMIVIASSLRETPRWGQEKMNHLAKISNIQLKGFAARSKIIADSHREVSNIIANSYRQRSASSDRSHRNYINAIREVEVYSSGDMAYELPSGYDHVFSDGTGNFILTDNHLLDPNVDFNTNANWAEVGPNR